MVDNVPVGIAGIGTYLPEKIEYAADLAEATGIPEWVLKEKMGIRQRRVAGPEETVTYMATRAAEKALVQAGVTSEQIDLVISHGSQHKDHLVWNSAAKIQNELGAHNAYGFEMYALCAGAPIAMHLAHSMMVADDRLNHVLLAVGSRENDLINYRHEPARFMYNFASGGAAMVLKRGSATNRILGASAYTDSTLTETVLMSQAPEAVGDGPEALGDLRGRLTVKNAEYMAERLGEVSLPHFARVITEAVTRSGAALSDVDFLGIVHMKRSFYMQILEAIGLTPEQSVYLEDYGHIQSADQALAIELGLAQGKIKPGDLLVLAGAGTGYTWSAIAVRWG
jgi:3-oxoacyl-[acyl-carrier-protein] synthase-3